MVQEGNGLLASLPASMQARLGTQIEGVTLVPGQILFDPGMLVGHAWFPTTAVLSLMHGMLDGHAGEAATVGREGFVGTPLLLGATSTTWRAVVQFPGHAWRLPPAAVDALMAEASARRLMLRYVQALMAQLSQTAICNRHHGLPQQVARKLLQCLDRLVGPDLHVTHDVLAQALGVRREGVTRATRELQHADILRCSRGRITVLDRRRLRASSCECYAVMADEYERLLA